MPWITNHKHKIEEKSTKSSRSSSKVVGLGPADLWEFPTLISWPGHAIFIQQRRSVSKWLGWWLVAWWHEAISWTNIGLPSLRSSGIHSRAMHNSKSKISISKLHLKFTYTIWNYSHISQGTLSYLWDLADQIWITFSINLAKISCNEFHSTSTRLW